MSRFFIILATSIALAGAGVPARAQVRMDNGNVIFGAVTLGLLAAILGDLKRKGDQMAATAPVTRPLPNSRPVPRRDPAPRPFTVKTVRTDLTGNGKPGQWHRPKPSSYYVSKRLVPAHCLRDVSRPGQSMRLLGRHCFQLKLFEFQWKSFVFRLNP